MNNSAGGCHQQCCHPDSQRRNGSRHRRVADPGLASLFTGDTATLTATVQPSNATNQNVTWSSDKPDVATVDAAGKVTAVGAGTATITVTTADGESRPPAPSP